MALPDYSKGSNISIAGSNAGAMGTLMQFGKTEGLNTQKKASLLYKKLKKGLKSYYREQPWVQDRQTVKVN